MDCGQPKQNEETRAIQRCQRGDREAFAPLVDRYQRRLFALVYRLIRRREEVEDLVQEIFLKAFSSVRSYNFQASFGTWITRIALNHCYDVLRRQAVARVSYHWEMSEDVQQMVAWRAETGERADSRHAEHQFAVRDLALKLLERAPARDQVVLVLKEVEGFSVEEIAEILGLKPTTVKVRLHRARKRMLEDLKRVAARTVGHAL